jgi:hypothetical protein
MTEAKSSEITPFDDKLVNFSKGIAMRLGCSKALILHHIWVTFAYHYDNKDVAFFARPNESGESIEEPRTWVYFTVSNFLRHIPLHRSKLLAALAELERDGWIEVYRQPGKRTLYRPSITRFCASSVYREEGAQFEREPDRYVPGGMTRPERGPVEKTTSPQTGPVPVQKGDRYQSPNGTGSHIIRELREEPRLKNSSARANALEDLEEGDGPGAEPGPDPAYEEEGTGGDDPVVWEDAMSHEERIEACARAYLEQPMGKVQFARTLLRFRVTMDEVRQRVAEIQTNTPPKTAATPSKRGGVGDGKGNPAGSA